MVSTFMKVAKVWLPVEPSHLMLRVVSCVLEWVHLVVRVLFHVLMSSEVVELIHSVMVNEPIEIRVVM